MSVLSIRQDNYSEFDKFMQNDHDLVKVVRFWAVWCHPCIALEPIYNEIAREMHGRAKFAEIDVDQSPSITASFGIRSVPSVIVFKDGKIANVIAGLEHKSKYIDAIEKAIG